MPTLHHKSIHRSGWSKLSLPHQLGNVGVEIGRAINWKDKDANLYQKCLERALELLDLIVADIRWRVRLKEILRAREVLADAIIGGQEYESSLDSIAGYFFSFAVRARLLSINDM